MELRTKIKRVINQDLPECVAPGRVGESREKISSFANPDSHRGSADRERGKFKVEFKAEDRI